MTGLTQTSWLAPERTGIGDRFKMPKKRPQADLIDRVLDKTLGDGAVRTTAGVSAWCLLAIIVLAIVFVGIPQLESKRSLRESDRAVDMKLMNAPEWFMAAPELAETMEARLTGAAGSNPFDRDGLVEAHRILVDGGWFDRLDRIERQADGTLAVFGTLANPSAVIRWKGMDHLVDDQGRLLDWEFEMGTASPSLPLITGTSTAPPRHADGTHDHGGLWANSDDLDAGLSLAALITTRPWSNEIGNIDVSDYHLDQNLWLECRSGPRILWGHAPGTRGATEITSEEKLRMIDSVHDTYGPFKQLDSNVVIDVRHDLATARRVAIGEETIAD